MIYIIACIFRQHSHVDKFNRLFLACSGICTIFVVLFYEKYYISVFTSVKHYWCRTRNYEGEL